MNTPSTSRLDTPGPVSSWLQVSARNCGYQCNSLLLSPYWIASAPVVAQTVSIRVVLVPPSGLLVRLILSLVRLSVQSCLFVSIETAHARLARPTREMLSDRLTCRGHIALVPCRTRHLRCPALLVRRPSLPVHRHSSRKTIWSQTNHRLLRRSGQNSSRGRTKVVGRCVLPLPTLEPSRSGIPVMRMLDPTLPPERDHRDTKISVGSATIPPRISSRPPRHLDYSPSTRYGNVHMNTATNVSFNPR